MNVHQITREFEAEIARYTGAPYCVCLENESQALYLSLKYDNVKGREISIPSHTYMSVPCEIINAGGKVKFYHTKGPNLKGAYLLRGSKVIDSALRFTSDMYLPGFYMCCSFTGPYKHLKLGKGGCILTDNEIAYKWFRKAAYSGRNAVSYHVDEFTMTGHNFYMNPVISALGLLLIQQFWNLDGTKKKNKDISLPYPDLSKFPIYENSNSNPDVL